MQRNRNLMLLLALGVSLASGACTVGPDYEKPAVAVPAFFTEAKDDAGPEEAALASWWHGFEDPLLDRLVADALAGNLDRREAASRIREARAREVLAGASARPRVGLGAAANRQRLSENSGILLPSQAPGNVPGLPGSSFSTFRFGFDAAWEIDLWGGTRRGVEAAEARTEAETWKAHDVDVALAADVARHYFEWRLLQRRIQLAGEALARQRDMGAIIDARTKNGLASIQEVEQQRRQVERAAAAIPPLEAEARVRIHMIAYLLGTFAERLPGEMTAPAAAAPPPLPVPAGLPSDLLRRRPDIRAAERRLAAATADIGVAVAELYPRFSLTGTLQLVSTSLARLISTDSIQAVAGAALDWPLLDGGGSRANVRIAEEQRSQTLIAYERAILTAFKDVEDALSRTEREQEKAVALGRAVAAARASADTARIRYRNGLTSFLEVLESESALIAVEDEAAVSEAQRRLNLVSLYKALGGGWSGEEVELAGGRN